MNGLAMRLFGYPGTAKTLATTINTLVVHAAISWNQEERKELIAMLLNARATCVKEGFGSIEPEDDELCADIARALEKYWRTMDASMYDDRVSYKEIK